MIPQNIVASTLNNKVWLVFMDGNVEKEKIMNLIVSNSSQGTTKEMLPLVSSCYPLPVMNDSTKSSYYCSNSTSSTHSDPWETVEWYPRFTTN